MVPRFMNPLTRAKTVSLLRAAIAVAFCALAVAPRLRSDEVPRHPVLAMEYFGAIDHPIPPIIISNSYGGAERYHKTLIQSGKLTKFSQVYLHVVSSPLLNRLITTVESDKNGVQQEPEQRSGPYNGVAVTIITQRGRKTFLFHVEQAMSLTDHLGNLVENDKSLHPDLLEFQDWISLWGDDPPPRPAPQDKP
jgi:hypothetical protein